MTVSGSWCLKNFPCWNILRPGKSRSIKRPEIERRKKKLVLRTVFSASQTTRPRAQRAAQTTGNVPIKTLCAIRGARRDIRKATVFRFCKFTTTSAVLGWQHPMDEFKKQELELERDFSG